MSEPKEYDGGYNLPGWWRGLYNQAVDRLGWKNPEIIKHALEIDPRKKWGPDRLVKMMKEGRTTATLLIAVSAALDIPSPVVLAQDQDEAVALKAWLSNHRRSGLSSKAEARRSVALQALDNASKPAKGQTQPLPSSHEGETDGGRVGRASRRR